MAHSERIPSVFLTREVDGMLAAAYDAGLVERGQDGLLRLAEPEGRKPEGIAEEVGRSAGEALEK